jgi:hypothetical protein
MPEIPAFAIVNVRGNAGQIEKLRTIPNLVFQRRPKPTDDANTKIVYALADASAMDQARALGCDVTVIKNAQEYSELIRNFYDNISDKPITID